MSSSLLACETPEAPRRTLRSIYFDTAAGDLRKERIALRIRKTGHGVPRWVSNGRRAPTVFSRGRNRSRIAGMQPDISLFDSNIAAEIKRVTKATARAAIRDFG